VGTTLVEIKDMVQLVAASRHFSDSNAQFFAGPDPTMGKPVYFEDSLGNILELPLQSIDDWEVRYPSSLPAPSLYTLPPFISSSSDRNSTV